MRLITLTLRSTADGLRSRLDTLRESFAALRRTDLWKTSVRNAIACIEVKLGKRFQWHVHVHILADGKYLPQPQLRAEWLRITGDSSVVDVRAVNDRSQAARYVSKYVAKVEGISGWTPAEVCEYAAAMHGRRMLTAYGSTKIVSEDDDAPDVEEPSSHVASAHAIERHRDKEPVRHAIEILTRLSWAASRVFGVAAGALEVPVDARESEFARAVFAALESGQAWEVEEAYLDSIRRRIFGSLPEAELVNERQLLLLDH